MVNIKKIVCIFTATKFVYKMRTFSGISSSKLDRGRCFLPAALRKEFPDTDTVRLKIRVTEDDEQYLEIYEESDWNERIDSFMKFVEYEDFDYEKEELLREYTASVENIDMIKHDDNVANIGRILIPKKLLDVVGIKNEVVFIGTFGKILVWDKEKYENRPIKGQLKARMKEILEKKKQK